MANKENAVLEHDMKIRHVLRMLCFFLAFLKSKPDPFRDQTIMVRDPHQQIHIHHVTLSSC